MRSAASPAASSCSTRSGRNRPFGTGRVMSQIRMQALALPRASSASGGAPVGRGERLAHRALGIRQHRHLALADHPQVDLVGQIDRQAAAAVVQLDALHCRSVHGKEHWQATLHQC